MKLTRACIIMVASFYWALSAQQWIDGPSEAVSFAPKPTKLTEYIPPHQPHTKLEMVKASHKGQAEWSEWVIRDDYLWSRYIQSAPGSKGFPSLPSRHPRVVGDPGR